MQVILKEKIKGLGIKGEVKSVKRGYFINFLGPRNMAIIATEGRIKEYEKIKETQIIKAKEEKENALKLSELLNPLVLNFKEKVSSKEKLFGSITEKEIIEKIKKEAKIELEKSQIHMKEHIKTLGEHEVEIKLTENVKAKVKVIVEAQ